MKSIQARSKETRSNDIDNEKILFSIHCFLYYRRYLLKYLPLSVSYFELEGLNW